MGCCSESNEFGAKVVTISGRDGYVYDAEGVNTQENGTSLLKSELRTMLS